MEVQQAVIRHAQNDMKNVGPEPVPKAEPAGPKVGKGHLAAMGRIGLKELAQALQAFPDSTIKPVEEPGAFGSPTAQIITTEMGYGMPNAADRAQYQVHDNDRAR